jgi:hypothetical protein
MQRKVVGVLQSFNNAVNYEASFTESGETKEGNVWQSTDTKMKTMELKYTEEALNVNTAPGNVMLCRPWSYEDYVVRVLSFRNTSCWFAKPSCVSPMECALYGWSCNTSCRDSLVCTACSVSLHHDSIGMK